MTIFLPSLDIEDPNYFPHTDSALKDPDGLLAIGGDLSSSRLISAYERGIFPWFSQLDPILWWSPSERAVIPLSTYKPSKSLKKFNRKHKYAVSINQCFEDVIDQCASIRGKNQTWITTEMQAAYTELHHQHRAHSVEVWKNQSLIGGFYGVNVGAIFCGESMFSLETNASKIALWFFIEHFRHHGGKLIDCQMTTDHLLSLGATSMRRTDFISNLHNLKSLAIDLSVYKTQWITGYEK